MIITSGTATAARKPALAVGADRRRRARLTPSGDPILAARFTPPPLPGPLVRRAGLLDRLTAGVRGPLTLVEGPAGAGKTVLVAHWAAVGAAPGPVVWLTVEPEDTPETFWAYVIAALRHHRVPLPGDLLVPGSTGRTLLTGLAAALGAVPEPVTLVLDEFDAAGSGAIADGLHYVLRHAAPRLRAVLTSRSDPSLPLHRYRTAGEITEIRSADLAFGPRTASLLLARHGLDLTPADVRLLVERTEGWAAGLRLSALALQRSDDPAAFLRHFATDRTAVPDFLLTEVLATQPATVQDLLLRASVVPRVHPELADALTGRDDAEQTLDRLDRANAFVERVGSSHWYRLHPLFAEVLRAHLRRRQPGLEPELRRRAARWLATPPPGHAPRPSPATAPRATAPRSNAAPGNAPPATAPPAPTVPMPAAVEPLSGRECEVLRQAEQLRSTEEIAAELHVSVNTVKTHLKSIHRKLCVTRRGDAVRRARQLDLL
jgi:LuxR family maltose regulon positive regulatory protein